MGKSEMKEVAEILHVALTTEKVDSVKKRVRALRRLHQTSEVLLRQLAGVLLPLGLPPDDEVGLGVLEITEF